MAVTEDGNTAAWHEWAHKLTNLLFPMGLGKDQSIGFGQVTLAVDFANADPQIANAEVHRIGDVVPANSPNFAPVASLFNSYRLFLSRIESAELKNYIDRVEAADSQQQTRFNMAAKLGNMAPLGATGGRVGGQPSAPDSALRSVFLPAYQLDTSFRQKYSEWQSASTRNNWTAGGVITCRVRLDAPSTSATETLSLLSPAQTTREAVVALPFLRLHKTVPLGPSAGQETTLLGIIDITSEVGEGGLRPSVPTVQLPNFSAANAPLTLTLKVSFTGLQAFAINPDSWFAEAAIKIYQRGLVQQDRDTFFGSNGVLSRRIFQVILGFQPTLTIIPENQTVFESLSRSYLNGDAVGIGPFTFDSKALAPNAGEVTDPQQAQSITIGPIASTVPILLGVVSIPLVSYVPQPGSILVTNAGGFVARFSLEWQQNGHSTKQESGNFKNPGGKSIVIPSDATQILLTIDIMTLPWPETWRTVLTPRFDKPVMKSFKLSGTVWDPKCEEV